MKRLCSQISPVAMRAAQSRGDQNPNRHSERGFTLLELIVIMAIISILITIAVLGIPEWRTNITLKATSRDVMSSFQFARVEAAKRNKDASVKVTKGGTGVGKCEVIIDGQTIREIAMPPTVEITKLEQPVGSVVAGADATYQFNSRGFPTSSVGIITVSNANRSYDVELKSAGGISLSKPY